MGRHDGSEGAEGFPEVFPEERKLGHLTSAYLGATSVTALQMTAR